MRRTTISLATFCSGRRRLVLIGAVVLALSACGRRGDPLPPRRPFPDGANNIELRQDGTRIRLSWTAPTRNTDGTTEKLELAEVEIRRHVIDIPALVEAQTKPFELETDEPEDDELTEGEPPEGELEPEPTPPPVPEPDAPVVAESASDPSIEGEPIVGSEGEDAEDEGPVIPPTPVLVVPNFAPESRPVTALVATDPGTAVEFEEEIDPSWIGKRLEYAVIYTNARNRRGPRSAVVQIEPVTPLPVPMSVAALAQDGHVLVSWEPGPRPKPDPLAPPIALPEPVADPATSEDTEAEVPTGPFFSVFRRTVETAEYPDRPVHPQPLTENEFQDLAATFHVESCYVLREVIAPPPPPEPELDPLDAVPEAAEALEGAGLGPEDAAEREALIQSMADRLEGIEPPDETIAEEPIVIPEFIVPDVPPLKNAARIESDPSQEVCLTPVDTFPTPAPEGLAAVASDNSVLLTWNAVDRPDVTGYRVYRRTADQPELHLVGEDVVPSYTDRDVVPGTTYFYAITTVDDAPEPNESVLGPASQVLFGPP